MEANRTVGGRADAAVLTRYAEHKIINCISRPLAAFLHSPGISVGFPWAIGPGRSDVWPAKARQISSRHSSEREKGQSGSFVAERADQPQIAARPVDPHKVGKPAVDRIEAAGLSSSGLSHLKLCE